MNYTNKNWYLSKKAFGWNKVNISVQTKQWTNVYRISQLCILMRP